MDRDAFDALGREDQATFLLGRIVREAVHLDSAVRTARAFLMNAPDDEAILFGGPDSFRAAIAECSRLLGERLDYPEAVREAGASAFAAAGTAYDERSRYLHDILTIDVRDAPPESVEIVQEDDRHEWKRVRLTRRKGQAAADTRVDLNHLHQRVIDLIMVTWRVRGLYLTIDWIAKHGTPSSGNLGGWFSVLNGDAEADWDGMVFWSAQ